MNNKTNKLSCLTVKNETPQSAEVYIHGDIVDDDMKAWLSECTERPLPGTYYRLMYEKSSKAYKEKTLRFTSIQTVVAFRRG